MDVKSNNNECDIDPDSTSNDYNDYDIREIAVVNRSNEFEPQGSNDSVGVTGSNDDTGVTEISDNIGVTVAYSSRSSKAYDYPKHFPETLQCGHYQQEDRRWMSTYFWDKIILVKRLREGTYFSES